MGRTIRRLSQGDLNAYTEIYLNAYPSGKSISKECYDIYFKRNLQSLLEFEHVNFFGLFEEDTLLSIMKLIDFDTNLFGEMNKATGLMSLAVHPLHKKKGAAKEMVEFFEKYTVESGGLVCMLLPFSIDYYRKLGYGYGTKLDEYKIPTIQLKASKNISKLRLINNDEIEKVLLCHSEYVKKNHGAVEKFEEEIRDIRNDYKTRRIGYFDGEDLKGYAAFDFISESDVNYALNRIEVSELIYTDGEMLKTLIGGLRLQADLAQNIVIRTGEADFHYLLDSPQDISANYINYGFLQTNVSALGTMYKIPNVRVFIEKTGNRKFPVGNLKIAFRVIDEQKSTEVRFGIKLSTEKTNSYSNWLYDENFDDADAEIKINSADLSSLLMGSADIAPMVRLGVISIDRDDITEELDRLFHCNQKPFTNTDY